MNYKYLNRQIFNSGNFALIPIRFEDRYLIMEWRNEQIYHLRQNKLLAKEDQDSYFNKIVVKEFIKEKPDQILFSFLKNDICIGYGGLVHINHLDKNAEVSFIMNTSLETTDFEKNWLEYLSLIQIVAFEEMRFHKIFTHAFDVRPRLYNVLLKANFCEEARLKGHCFFENNFIDVLIHSKFNSYASNS